MQQVSNILKINVKINLEVNVVDMTKNKMKNKIHHTKIGQDMLLTHSNMIVSLEINKYTPFGWCMQKLSNILKINVKINMEVNVADMTKNKLENKILHTKIRSIHASNPLKYACVTENKNSLTIWLVYAPTEPTEFNVKIN